MEYKLSEQDLVDNHFSWLALHTYDFWIKGESLEGIKRALLKGATKGHKIGDDFYNQVIKYIDNTYELLCNNDDDKIITTTKVLALNSALILSKKVANNNSHAENIRLTNMLKELVRIGSSLDVFNSFMEAEFVEHNIKDFEHKLTVEIDRFEKQVAINKGASIADTVNLLKVIDITLKCRVAKHVKKRNALVFIAIIGVALVIFY